MSLDDTYHALERFSRQLEAFNQALHASYRELRERHDVIDGLWRDEARRTYDLNMEEIEGRLGQYLAGDSERYEEFIRQKLRQLSAYLHGS
jgi:hypothetical protein